MFGKFVRILDKAALHGLASSTLTGRPIPGWGDVGERLDEWIRAAGLSPEQVRAAARA